MIPEESTKPMALLQVPEDITCPTEGCGHKATHHFTLSPNCHNPGCLWFFCDVCEHTTWFSPRTSTSSLGRRVIRWGSRASRRIS